MVPDDNKKGKQLSLFDHGENAKDTRALAFEQSRKNEPGKREVILELFRTRGRLGYTRWEIADALELPANCITSPVLYLLRKGTIVKTAEARRSRLGGLGRVLQLVEVSNP